MQVRISRHLVSTLMVLACGCSCLQPHPDKGEIQHIVVVWLKEPGNAEARQKLIDTSKSFKAIPGLKRISVGPVLPSPLQTVDSTFDVAVVFTFENEQSLRAYNDNPIHQAAVRDVLQPLASRFIAYDFRVE